jgi:hypothetical protein
MHPWPGGGNKPKGAPSPSTKLCTRGWVRARKRSTLDPAPFYRQGKLRDCFFSAATEGPKKVASTEGLTLKGSRMELTLEEGLILELGLKGTFSKENGVKLRRR